MQMRCLGKTGLQVSEIGFGAFQLGNRLWGDMSETEAVSLVHEALDLGCNLFDTAPNYGRGESERLLGKALQGRRDQQVIVSKFGHFPDDSHDFSANGLWRSLDASLQRLNTDFLDVVLIHSPPLNVLDAGHEVWGALREAQQQGKIRHYGASVDLAQEVEALKDSGAEVVEVLFNMLHQDVRSALPMIRQQNIGVIAKVPLDSGWLSGKYTASTRFDDIRTRWSQQEIEQRFAAVSSLREILGNDDGLSQNLQEQALAFLLSYSEVSAVIPGVRTIGQLQANLRAAGKRLPHEAVIQVERFWDQLTHHGENRLPW